ncbi:sensor histidine kinase [Nocardiopsis sediminis]|uniref:histidine kinase n=1 Tax=Nocardiopsis sediminis TaxID=1778267 RepID=A0ABV8FII8_9ACTN
MTTGSMVMITVFVVLAFTTTSVVGRNTIERELIDLASGGARAVIAQTHDKRFPGPIPPQAGIVRLQIVDTHGRVVAASAVVSTSKPLSTVRPRGADLQVESSYCTGHRQRCYTVVGIHTRATAYGDVIVYGATPQPSLLTGYTLEILLGSFTIGLVAVAALLTWVGVGRTLRPVERIRADLERFSASEPGHRLRVPESGDELADLARTGNETLDRLEGALARQRSFVSDASHELRNPIAGLRTRLEVELDDPTGGDPRGALAAVLADVERLQRIVGDLLELARIDADVATEWRPVDLGVLAADEAARPTEGIEAGVDAEAGVVARGNRLRLARLLDNLLANARRHARSRITVVVRSREGEAVLEVHDDGNGIAPGDRERVFERFARLEESRERDPGGSGLGLAICREIAVAHGGTLTAGESPALGGALMTLTLPSAPGRDRG